MAAQAETVNRYDVAAADSSLTIEARSTLHAVRAAATGLTGYVVAGWNPDGSLAAAPAPIVHVEFPLDQVRSGNSMQDREMRRLVDAGRFPKASGDLRSVDANLAARRVIGLAARLRWWVARARTPASLR